MNKKSIRIISTVLTIAIVLMTLTAPVFAANELDGINTSVDLNDGGKLNSVGNTILTLIRTVGIFIAVGILMVLGIKYMMGSAEEKADYKKSMIPYIVGAVLIFASTTIVGIVYDLANALNSSGNEVQAN